MSLLPILSLLSGFTLHVSLSVLGSHQGVPRKTVPYQNEYKVFREEGIFNYSTMLMREDLGLLLLGAREAIYAVDANDISVKKAADLQRVLSNTEECAVLPDCGVLLQDSSPVLLQVYWRVTEEKQKECTYKGKQAQVECRNYIRTLHKVNDTTMYVCGTNAFSPTCDYMTFVDGQLRLEGKQEKGQGKCPFDPFQRYSSLMVGNDLYSATSINFLGSEPVVLRSSDSALRTEFKSSWLNEPNFVYMDVVAESLDSPDGDDDKVYLFFSENAVEYDFYSKVAVSRVARVCKGDMGGQRTLQRKWTSFMKARLDCSFPELSLPPIVQDVFLLRDEDWRRSVFYAVFTSQSVFSQLSVVCAYSVTDIGDIFSEGKFKTSVAVETSHIKWVMYTGEMPVPRPGADLDPLKERISDQTVTVTKRSFLFQCINNLARKMGMNRSLDLPDKTLQFIRDRPLMDEAVRPLSGGPLLVRRGALLTRIVVDRVLALDGQTHAVMFVGTENGYIHKAVNYDGEMFVIEEIQAYENPVPINTLSLSASKGQVYAGSESGAVQVPVCACGRHDNCADCVLARDPYCAWDLATEQCASVRGLSGSAVQSLKEGDLSRCPEPDPIAAVDVVLVPGNNVRLPCQVHSNLAQVLWQFSNQTLHSSNKHYVYSGGLLIANASESDAGLYTCYSVEDIRTRTFTQTLAVYKLQLNSGSGGLDSTTPDHGLVNTSDSFHGENTAVPGQMPEASSPENRSDPGRVTRLEVAVALLSLLCFSLIGFIFWNWSQGRLSCFKLGQRPVQAEGPRQSGEYMHVPTRPSEIKLPQVQSERPFRAANNNHSAVDFKRTEERRMTPANVSTLNGLGYINDESEI